VWLNILGLMVAVIGAWSNLRALVVRLIKIPVALARGIYGMITCPDPLSIQLADAVDGLGYHVHGWFDSYGPTLRYPRLFIFSTVPLTTWLRRPAAGLDSYRRHLRVFREFRPG
jgi:hypothetical protein